MVDTEMTSTPTQKPETIRLADALKRRTPFLDGSSTIDHAEKELRRQHAEIARLTAENEALRAVVAEAVAEEREACAEIATDEDNIVDVPGYSAQLGDARATARKIEKAIRARGTT